MKTVKRIEFYTPEKGMEHRDMTAATREDGSGDILIELDGGDRWRFTPQQRMREDLNALKLDTISRAVKHRLPRLSSLFGARNATVIWGDFTALPPAAAAATDKPPKRPYKSWPDSVQDKVRTFWDRYSRNKLHPRLIDCYETHKHTLPERITSKDDFKKCLAAAQKTEKKRKATERRWKPVSRGGDK